MIHTPSPSTPEKQAIRLQLLNEVSACLQGMLESDDFYAELISVIQKQLHYYSVQIWTVLDGDAEIVLSGQAGAYSPYLKVGHKLQVSSGGITGFVVRSHRPYLANDVTRDPVFTNLSLPVQTQAQLCAPIQKEGKVIGTINIESDQKNSFDESDVLTLETLASQLGVAITNRRLFNQVKDFNKQLQSAVEAKTLELREANSRILALLEEQKEQQKALQKENKVLKTLVSKEGRGAEIIGQSPAMVNLLNMVDKIAPTGATVLIQGESGTGKELIARRLHAKSDRADKPYVTVNCGALQEALLESELFGHEKGSFTGAVVQKLGLVETADGGTLFLDEIAEMSLAIQAKLLRFLQEGEFYRIGGKRSLQVSCRVVSASNQDLEQAVKLGKFREDLFYRLNTITLRIPPLRKRREDIPLLLDFFLKNSRLGGSSALRRVDPKVYEAFANYDWPGNIRELQNTIERLKILAEGPDLRLDDLPVQLRGGAPRAEAHQEPSVNTPLEEVERHHILQTLSFNQGNKTKTAHSLGITIKTLYNKLHRYGVLDSHPSSPEGQADAPEDSVSA